MYKLPCFVSYTGSVTAVPVLIAGHGYTDKGGKEIRDMLYMYAMNANKTNPAYKVLFERFRNSTRPGKLALIALCDKLLKQVLQL